ncbi:MAG: hypothetical protein R2824_11235 [Saprospiraceae bacterium]
MKVSLISLLLLTITLTSCKEEIKVHEFPGRNFEKIMAYKMNGEEGEVVEDGAISDKVIGEGKLLTKRESRKLLGIFHDKSSYGESAYLCFEPHVGYVFYDNENEIIAHSTICLKCNWMKNFPAVGGYAFSEKGNKRFEKFEEKIFQK